MNIMLEAKQKAVKHKNKTATNVGISNKHEPTVILPLLFGGWIAIQLFQVKENHGDAQRQIE